MRNPAKFDLCDDIIQFFKANFRNTNELRKLSSRIFLAANPLREKRVNRSSVIQKLPHDGSIEL